MIMMSIQTRPRAPRARWVVTGVGVATALALGGCASTDVDGVAAASARSAASTTAAPTTAPPKNVFGYLYTRDTGTEDFTIKESPYADNVNSSDASPFRDLAECLQVTERPPVAAAEGAVLASGNGGTVQVASSAQIVTPGQVDRHVQILRGPRFESCLMSYINDDESEEGVTVGEIQRRTTPVPAGALARISYVLPVTTDDRTVAVYSDIVFLGSGSVESQLVISSALQPADDLVIAATDQLVAKLKQQ